MTIHEAAARLREGSYEVDCELDMSWPQITDLLAVKDWALPLLDDEVRAAAERILSGREPDSFLMSDARMLARKLLDRKPAALNIPLV